jgi:2-oxoglutarate/2-oxoacid ferredoxin oxidoreductase subunit beta
MNATDYDRPGVDMAWCPGCGNFAILKILKQALAELGIPPQRLVVASGIGQAPKTPHYFQTHLFNGLHGRALPVATGIKAANPELLVIAEGGDGDMYGEGGNHFLHTVRRNPDLTHLVHNNMVYGLTKGQASPTSLPGFVTPLQTEGVFQEPFNPLAAAIALNASFVARTFAGAFEESVAIFKQALTHPGYALVDIFQPCVTFNRVNTFQWFKEHSYFLDDDHHAEDRAQAFQRAIESDPWPLGIFYRNPARADYIGHLAPFDGDRSPLHTRRPNLEALARVLEGKRSN